MVVQFEGEKLVSHDPDRDCPALSDGTTLRPPSDHRDSPGRDRERAPEPRCLVLNSLARRARVPAPWAALAMSTSPTSPTRVSPAAQSDVVRRAHLRIPTSCRIAYFEGEDKKRQNAADRHLDRGTRASAVTPRPSRRAVRLKLPPRAITICRLIARPSPVPPARNDTNGSNTLRN